MSGRSWNFTNSFCNPRKSQKLIWIQQRPLAIRIFKSNTSSGHQSPNTNSITN